MTKSSFRQHAKPVNVVINGVPMIADPKDNSTGSIGWNINGKMSIQVNGESVPVQIGLNLTVVKSKEMPES